MHNSGSLIGPTNSHGMVNIVTSHLDIAKEGDCDQSMAIDNKKALHISQMKKIIGDNLYNSLSLNSDMKSYEEILTKTDQGTGLDINVSKLITVDEHLKYFTDDILKRVDLFKHYLQCINSNHGGLITFSKSYQAYGIHFNSFQNIIRILEYIPDVNQVFIYGSFNNYEKYEYPLKKGQHGTWSLEIPAKKPDGSMTISHKDDLHLLIITKNDEILHRISPWSKFVIQDPESHLFKQVLWNPRESYQFIHPKIAIDIARTPLLIYEAHVGIASNDETISSYNDFRLNILPRIKKQGYNCLMLMAIQHHALYSSFGYQVTSFFSP